MQALLVVDQYPFPARNGVTIPTSNYALLLEELGYQVHIVIIKGDRVSAPDRRVSTLDFIRSPWRAALKELLLVEPFFAAYRVDERMIRQELLSSGPYELVVASPVSACKFASRFVAVHQDVFGKRPISIAAISDFYAAVLETGLRGRGVKAAAVNLLRRARAFLMRRLEPRLLQSFDRVFVQTELDRQRLRAASCDANLRIEVVTNGVNSALFSIKPTYGLSFLFVADIRVDHYRLAFLEFYSRVWREFAGKHKSAKLYIFSPMDEAFSAQAGIDDDASVVWESKFVDDISDVYSGKAFCIAPIFKEYGFINKVAEAMAAGVVVLGDRSAFNGIAGVKDGESVLVAKGLDDFVRILGVAASMSEDEFRAAAEASREIARQQFCWSDRKRFFDIS